MNFEHSAEWPWSIWPDYVEVLRAFASDDVVQSSYFPRFEEARHFDLYEGSMLAEDAFCPTFNEMSHWSQSLSFNYSLLESENEERTQMLDRLGTAFRQAGEQTWRPGRTMYDSRTDVATLEKLRPDLRALCLEALSLFGESFQAPTTPWDDIIIP